MSIRRVGVLLSKEFLYGSKSYIFIFAVVGPIVISIVLSLIFGTWLSEKPRLGVMDEGSSQLVSMIQEKNSVESIEYGTVSEMKKAVESGSIDAGIVLPSGFDSSIIRGEMTEIKAYIWGESLAKSRTIIGVTISSLARELAGQETPIEIETTTLGDEVSMPWSDRLLPFIVLMAVFLGGLLLPATSLANEKEKKTLGALTVTPTSIGDVFLAKGMLGFILSLFMGVLILALNQAFGAEPILLTVLLALGAIMATELGVMLGAYVKDFATIFTIWKSAGIILFAPAIIYLFPQIPGWIGRIFPTYYVTQPIVEISQLGGSWADIATNTFVLIAIDIVLIIILLFILRRKQYEITGGN